MASAKIPIPWGRWGRGTSFPNIDPYHAVEPVHNERAGGAGGSPPPVQPAAALGLSGLCCSQRPAQAVPHLQVHSSHRWFTQLRSRGGQVTFFMRFSLLKVCSTVIIFSLLLLSTYICWPLTGETLRRLWIDGSGASCERSSGTDAPFTSASSTSQLDPLHSQTCCFTPHSCPSAWDSL